MGLSAVGRTSSTTIFGGASRCGCRASAITAVIVLFCAVHRPRRATSLFMLTVLLAVRRPPAPRWVGEMLRWGHLMQPWSMNEVMMLGILVALIKIAELATVDAGIGMYAVGALVVLLPAIAITFDPARDLAARIEWADGREPPGLATRRRRAGARRHGDHGRRSRPLRPGSSPARTCSLLSRPASAAEPGYCPRCGAELASAPPRFHPVHVGARHRRGDLLHPGEPAARAHHDHARVHRRRHDHGRRASSSTPRARGRSRSSCWSRA